MYESHQDTSNEKHTFPEPNTYDYASQLMFDANAFAAMSNQIDLSSGYLEFFNQQQQHQHQHNHNEAYEMMRYQAAMQSHDYASSCSSNNTPPTTYGTYAPSQTNQLQVYPMMAFHASNSNNNEATAAATMDPLTNMNAYPIPYDHNHHHHHQQQAYLFNHPPMPTLSTSSSSTSSSISSSNTQNHSSSLSDNRGAQVYVRKACVSCKQSHVACDVQRPCARCVRLNKADTCVDAERKKRGRPCGSSKKKKESMMMSTAAAAVTGPYL